MVDGRIFVNYKKGEEEMKTAIVEGIMNFSVLFRKNTAFKANQKDYTAYKDSILNRKRLEIREKILFSYTIPLFIKTHDSFFNKGIIFRLNIAIPDQLPTFLMDRFNQLAENHANIFNIIKVSEELAHDWLNIVTQDVVKVTSKYQFPNEIMIYNFRLDDDDLLSEEYYTQIQNYLLPNFSGFYLTCSKGYVSVFKDAYESFYAINKPYLAIGLAKISMFSKKKNIFLTDDPIVMSRSHTTIVNNSKTILDSTINAFVWTMHLFSDTRSLDKNTRQSESKISQYISELESSKLLVNELEANFFE